MAKSVNRSIRIFVNGKEVEHSLNSVRKEMLRLSREVNSLEKGSEAYVKKSAEYRKVAGYYREIRREITGMPTMFDRLSKSAGGFVSILTGFFAVSSIFNKFQQLIDLSAQLADKQSDVQKTTGMTKKEVRELTQELDKLNTRTSRVDLLSIAEEGGRIGIAKDEIAEFTEAMDKANVALGDVFGSASEVASTLGKLKFMFKETSDMGVSEAYNAIGSALNELGANGIASEQNIAAFASRLGALPPAFKPTIADALALGAAFEESGVNAEVAGRSYSILIQQAATNIDKFAKQMNMTAEEAKTLINTNPTEFFLQFTNSFKGMETNGTKMAGILKELGINANGVNMIIGAGANGNDRFRESLELANIAMAEGTSMTDEFNTKNENLAATIEKIEKSFVEWIDSDKVQDFIEGLVNWFGGLIGAIDTSDRKASTFIKTLDFSVKVIGIVIASFFSWTAAMKLSALWTSINVKNTQLFTLTTKGATLAQTLHTIAVSAAGVVYNRLAGNTYAAMRAQVALNAAMRANPWGLALTVITAVVSAIALFRSKTKEAADEQKEFGEAVRDAHRKATDGMGKTISKINILVNAIKDENISLATRKKAYAELIKIAPEFNGYLVDEKFNIEGLNRAYKGYVTHLQNVARAKATVKLREDAAEAVVAGKAEMSQLEVQIANERKKLADLKAAGKDTQEKPVFSKSGNIIAFVEEESKAYRDQRQVIQELEKEFAALEKTQQGAEKKEKSFTDYNSAEIARVQAEIKIVQSLYDAYDKEESEQAKKLAANSKMRLTQLKQELAGLGFLDTDTDTGTGGTGGNDTPTGEDELSRRQKTAEEILKLERDTNRRLRDEKLKNREEEATLMQEGWDQDLELLRIKKEKRLNALADELEDLEILRQEYQKKANEEAAKGNKAGAAGFRAQAAELQKIADEKNKTYLYVEQTFQFDLERLKLEHYKKEQEKHQKQFERELRNLQTKHNNELKAVTDLEEAKEVLRNQYGFSDEELDKIKNFEKAKSEIILAQQQETYKLQSEQLQGQIEEIKNTLAVDDALGATIFGKMMDEEQREQLMEFLEELENRLSNLNNPEGGGGDDADEEKKVMGFIDLFGFSGDQWDQAFSNLDTMSGKLQLAQMGVQAMMNAWNMYYQMQRQNMQRDLDQFTSTTNKKKSELKKQLDEGYISQESYNAQVEKLEADLEKKRAEMEYKSAMTEWKMSMMQAATNTALGITSALSMQPAGIVLAAIVGAMGTLQIGMIAANKPKKPEGYFTGGESGGAGRYDHLGRELADGPLHAREYVIPEWLRKDPQIAQMEEFIEARRRGRSPVDASIGYAAGGEARPANPASSSETVTNSFPSEVLPVLHRLADVLEYLQDNPIEAKLTRSMEVAKHISDDMEDYKNHRIKNKR